MSNQELKEEKKSFDVDQLSVGTRKIIRLVVMAVIMLMIFLIWVPLAINSINHNVNFDNTELSGVGKDLEIFLEQIQTKINGVDEKNKKDEKDEALVTPTSTINNQVGQGMNDLLVSQLTGDWQEYADIENRFSIKYPGNFYLTTSSETLLKLNQVGTTTKVFEIKKFVSYSSLANMINIKKIIQRPDHFLVIIDFINNTTTNIIFNSFKLIDNNL